MKLIKIDQLLMDAPDKKKLVIKIPAFKYPKLLRTLTSIWFSLYSLQKMKGVF